MYDTTCEVALYRHACIRFAGKGILFALCSGHLCLVLTDLRASPRVEKRGAGLQPSNNVWVWDRIERWSKVLWAIYTVGHSNDSQTEDSRCTAPFGLKANPLLPSSPPVLYLKLNCIILSSVATEAQDSSRSFAPLFPSSHFSILRRPSRRIRRLYHRCGILQGVPWLQKLARSAIWKAYMHELTILNILGAFQSTFTTVVLSLIK